MSTLARSAVGRLWPSYDDDHHGMMEMNLLIGILAPLTMMMMIVLIMMMKMMVLIMMMMMMV